MPVRALTRENRGKKSEQPRPALQCAMKRSMGEKKAGTGSRGRARLGNGTERIQGLRDILGTGSSSGMRGEV